MPGSAPHWPPAAAPRPRPALAGALVLAPDWLLALTEVRAVSHTRVHVDLGAGTDITRQPMSGDALYNEY